MSSCLALFAYGKYKLNKSYHPNPGCPACIGIQCKSEMPIGADEAPMPIEPGTCKAVRVYDDLQTLLPRSHWDDMIC